MCSLGLKVELWRIKSFELEQASKTVLSFAENFGRSFIQTTLGQPLKFITLTILKTLSDNRRVFGGKNFRDISWSSALVFAHRA